MLVFNVTLHKEIEVNLPTKIKRVLGKTNTGYREI